MNIPNLKRAPRNPPHLFIPNAIYMITASTYQKENLIKPDIRKHEWSEAILKAADLYKWQVIAWVILDNHYHAIVRSPEMADTLSKFVASYHKFIAKMWNEEDNETGRMVWWNYWDTCIRSEVDYYNRLKYVFWNPVKHGLTQTPDEYLFSNYKTFLDEWQTDSIFIDTEEVNDVPEF